ncbi:hypothetical protein Hanom_Chr13g01203881 [Helianthus anomalus]
MYTILDVASTYLPIVLCGVFGGSTIARVLDLVLGSKWNSHPWLSLTGAPRYRTFVQ